MISKNERLALSISSRLSLLIHTHAFLANKRVRPLHPVEFSRHSSRDPQSNWIGWHKGIFCTPNRCFFPRLANTCFLPCESSWKCLLIEAGCVLCCYFIDFVLQVNNIYQGCDHQKLYYCTSIGVCMKRIQLTVWRFSRMLIACNKVFHLAPFYRIEC